MPAGALRPTPVPCTRRGMNPLSVGGSGGGGGRLTQRLLQACRRLRWKAKSTGYSPALSRRCQGTVKALPRRCKGAAKVPRGSQGTAAKQHMHDQYMHLPSPDTHRDVLEQAGHGALAVVGLACAKAILEDLRAACANRMQME